jgi:S-methylmethionine-dependent homocysteine/selenocysteine methylase
VRHRIAARRDGRACAIDRARRARRFGARAPAAATEMAAAAAAAASGHRRALLLDGGMAHQLKRMGVGLRTKRPFQLTGTTTTGGRRDANMERILGVALANTRTPKLVRDAHVAFIDAGAEIITTNNYAVVPATLRTCEDISDDGDFTVESIIPQVLRAAGRAARAAVEARPERNVRVAGCLPPLNDSYMPDRVESYEQNLMEYRMIVGAIAPYSDLLLCETMSTGQEARAAVQAGSEAGLPVWCSWTLDEAQPLLRSGETIGDALEALGPDLRSSVQAFLFNCTSTASISLALRQLLVRRSLCLQANRVFGVVSLCSA